MKEIYKTPKESMVETRYIVLPEHANHYGTAFGGVILSWIDLVAAMVAERHCQHEAVTVSIDRISFFAPIYIGDHVLIKASVNYTGNTSMEIGVVVIKENPKTGEKVKATKAYLTFVGLDKNKKPKTIPKVKPETEEEIRRFNNAKIRVQKRKEELKLIEKNQT